MDVLVQRVNPGIGSACAHDRRGRPQAQDDGEGSFHLILDGA
jgi:hypothetical protein